MSENEKEKKFVTNEQLVEGMEKLFQKNSYFHAIDCQLSFAIGIYFQRANYAQKEELKTNALQKKLRPQLDNINQLKLEKLLNECNKVFIHVQTKKRESGIRNELLRQKAHDLLVSIEKWESEPARLSLCFVMGFEFYWKLFRELYPKEKNEN